jgi:CRISPR system Cascade subunit CasD
MTKYLLFTLAAPLASFGAVAVGERRPTWDRPSKSQIVGLVAGCLGIQRTQEARQQALTNGLGFAVRVDARGQLARDYHTAQSPKEVSMKRRAKAIGAIRTRADELACDDLKTILSEREYIVGSLHTIALWRIGGAEPALDIIAAGLKSPSFAPFAGRKAYPLMLPMAPQLIDAYSIEIALATFDAGEDPAVKSLKQQYGLVQQANRPIFTDLCAIPGDQRHLRINRYEERRDLPESRAKWRFGLRSEALLRQGKEASQ